MDEANKPLTLAEFIAMEHMKLALVEEAERNGTLVVADEPDGTTRFQGTVVVSTEGWENVMVYRGTA